MAYRLDPEEPLHAGAGRIVRDEVEGALAELDAGSHERDTRVHRARRHLKRARAVLRLVRPGSGPPLVHLDRQLRDAARLVATTRDAAVAVQAFDAVRERFPDETDWPAFRLVRTGLVLRHRSLILSTVTAGRIDDLRSELEHTRRTMTPWAPGAGGFEAIAPGLAATYRSGRVGMAAAYRRPSAERFHDWRRHVRYHALHAALLRGGCGRVAESRIKRAGRLAETLGVEHDLSVLGALLVERPARFGGPAAVFPLLDLIERRRAELRAVARPAGKRLFRARPAHVVDRFGQRWADRPGRGATSGTGFRRTVAA